MTVEGARFSILDYSILIGTLLLSFGIGIGTAFKGNKSPEEFLMGNRSFGVLPVALSLLMTFVSAVNLIGFNVETYTYGMQFSMTIVGAVLGIFLATFLTLPVLYPLKLTSVNEYVELRYKSTKLRIFIMILILFQATVFMGVCLYAPSIALAAVTPLSYTTYIFLMGIICTIYSTVGGIRAVIWTDVFQFVVTMIGMIVILVAGTIKAGGVGRVISIAKEGGRLDIFNMNPSLYERHNFYNTIVFGFSLYVALYGISQVNVQRICCVSSISKARKVLAINAVGYAVIHGMIFAAGLVVYANYAGCDPTLDGKIPKKEAMFSYFIVDQLQFIPGLPGIFVATLIASTLSTFSSVVNAQVAIVWKDFLSKISFIAKVKPTTAALINKLLSFVIGFLFMGMAMIASNSGNMLQLVLTIGGMVFGPVYGLFILGIWFPRSNLKGAWSGLFLSYFFLVWIYIGSLLYAKPPTPLPLSTESCEHVAFGNSTLHETGSVYALIPMNGTNSQEEDNSSYTDFPLMYLYGISYTLYPLIGPLLCIIIGVIVSYITGALDSKDVELELIAPCLRKYYTKYVREEINLQPKETYEMKLYS